MDNIRLIFVLSENHSEEKDASEIMLQAFEACKQNVKTDVSWVKESNFKSLKLNKTDFVIFEDFKGRTFDNLKESKCARILGPWAISICLMEGKAIPNFPWPIYNVAMYECIVTSSNLPKATKLEIKEKVQLMGGCYVDTLVEKITHLVTDNPKSEKYLAAAEAGVSLRCSSWIDAVWVASQSANVHANDKEFEKYTCLPFQNLHISCTGLTGAKERKDIEKLITQHGGKYSPKLNLFETDVLICSGPGGAISEKYKAARKRANIKCVNISWLEDSIQKGYALPHHLYQVQKTTSTPTKAESHVNPDFSVLSAIGAPNTSQRILVDDTVNVISSPAQFRSPLRKPGPNKRKGNLKEYCQLVDNLDIKRAKRAGHYLDGCSVYITGFNPEHTEKLSKILNLSGATRYDQFSERVTHVIIGDPKYHEVGVIVSKGFQCLLVSVHWLIDSIEKEQPVDEEKYLLSTSDLDRSDFSSPLSKRGVNLLRSNNTITEIDVDDTRDKTTAAVEDNVENNILQQYLKPTSTIQEDDTLAQLLKDAGNTNFSKEIQELPKGTPQFNPSETSTQQSSTAVTQDASSQMGSEMFLNGLKFLVMGFEDTHFDHIKEIIEGFSGELVPKSYKGIPDYIVVPVFNNLELRHTAGEVVNELYISQCAQEFGSLSEILYYHRPFDVPDATLLENCVITISGYSSYERSFLMRLIVALGGQNQDQFARMTSQARGVVASTHLVSDRPDGKKYLAALKWGRPVVNKDWLLTCAETGQRVPESSFLVKEGTGGSAQNTPSRSLSDTNKITTLSTAKISRNLNVPISKSSPMAGTSKDDTAELISPQKEAPGTSSVRKTPSTGPGTNHILENINVSQIHTPEDSAVTNNTMNTSSSRVLTPINQMLPRKFSFNDSTDKPFTQATPVNKIVQQYRESNLDGTPGQDSPEKFRWMGIKTPDTPLGACICANPSPQLRKECELWLRQFPDFVPPAPRRLSTPLSEIKRQLWSKILNKGNEDSPQQVPNVETVEDRIEDEEMGVAELAANDNEPSSPEENTQNQLINTRLQQLEDMLTASGGRRRQSRNFQSTIPIPEGTTNYKDSQAGTVGWDFTEEKTPPKMRIFILSGIGESARATMVDQIENLGAAVSDLYNYDPSGTHLLCPKPLRNEKTLSCMAAGKWCLHTSYLEKSVEAGHFLDEEEYEFGNPKAVGKFGVQFEKDTETRMNSMHWWRKEVARRGYGAFNDMRAIVVAQKRDPIIRVIEAGGGVVIDVSPPFDDAVHATHCFLEQRSVRDYADYIPLAQQGIYLLNTIYISEHLHQPDQDVRDCILPYFAKYYTRK